MNIQDRYNEVMTFNEIAGNLNNVTVEKLEAQMKVFIEESKETAEAFENKDSVELLDGICDSFVTLAGLIQMAEKLGFNVSGALYRVNNNNLEKFPDNISASDMITYADNGWEITPNIDQGVFVLKDANGKIRKPVGFKPVQIADLAPDVFGGAA